MGSLFFESLRQNATTENLRGQTKDAGYGKAGISAGHVAVNFQKAATIHGNPKNFLQTSPQENQKSYP